MCELLIVQASRYFVSNMFALATNEILIFNISSTDHVSELVDPTHLNRNLISRVEGMDIAESAIFRLRDHPKKEPNRV